MKNLCNDCGLCCRFEDGTDCKWLRYRKNGKTFCRIFLTRLGRSTGRPGFLCFPIMMIPKMFKDCPYNWYKLRAFWKRGCRW